MLIASYNSVDASCVFV